MAPSRVVILCGLPGSGKSALASRLCESIPAETLVISADDGGKEFHPKLAQVAALDPQVTVIVDACHCTMTARQSTLESLALPHSTKIVWVVFKHSDDSVTLNTRALPICEERIKTRQNHATLKPEKAKEALAKFTKEYQPFQAQTEGKGAEVVRVYLEKPIVLGLSAVLKKLGS